MIINKLRSLTTAGIALLCAVSILTSCTVTKVGAENLMASVSAGQVSGKSPDSQFTNAMTEFYISLFNRCTKDDENTLISPLSVMLALSMTANGAKGETLSQMESALGGIGIDELNKHLYSYTKSISSDGKVKLHLSNSIWFKSDEARLTVEKDFLQRNADYYGASVYKSGFDSQTLRDINQWVKEKTDGMIDSILEEINPDAVMYLINALVFDAEWETIYNKDSIITSDFTALSGEKQLASMMHSEENQYLENDRCIGFLKSYAGRNFSFAAILPNDEVGIKEFASTITPQEFTGLIENKSSNVVNAAMPKFSYDCTFNLNDTLKKMGIVSGFDESKADFTGLGKLSSGNIFISDVVHKTFVAVDERGTKAGAVTKVEMNATSIGTDTKAVVLNRPFVYAIIDNNTGLPFFIGTVISL